MDEQCWYKAEALMADLTSHCHEILSVSEEEIGRRMRIHYPDAVTILVANEQDRRLSLEATWGEHKEDFGR